MIKYMLGGLLEGMHINDSMGFLSWEDACDWAAKCTMNVSCDFVVLEMRDSQTGEVEKF
jgi:hypothetical protein